MEALITRSIQEASRRQIVEVSLGVAPRVIASEGERGVVDRAMRTVYWGFDRFARSATKFGPSWKDRYIAIPGSSALPEVMAALVRAHMPAGAGSLARMRRAAREAAGRPENRRRLA